MLPVGEGDQFKVSEQAELSEINKLDGGCVVHDWAKIAWIECRSMIAKAKIFIWDDAILFGKDIL